MGRPRQCHPHGTWQRYKQERYLGVESCRPCKNAIATRAREQRAARTAARMAARAAAFRRQVERTSR